MTSEAAQTQQAAAASDHSPGAEPLIRIIGPQRRIDMSSVLGIILSVALIAFAITLGQSDASFFDVPSVLIVICGTITATSIAFTGQEMRYALKVIGNSIFRKHWDFSAMARQLLDLAMISRKKGLLILSSYGSEMGKDPILANAVQLVTDGYSGEDIERVMSQEIDALVERHRRSAGILRRGAEIAPAMGLIGTLVGLVQMLAELDNPDAIGPAMAVALLTTFYGAILGMVILNPLAAKLERNSGDEVKIRTMIMIAMASIARQENPRRLEMLLNSELPPKSRIHYFD